ncbi:MAG TPA: aminodeoxychorismate/anthranilate synthase component II [Planctomicrobium sp.]|nr:aminodeoxychorismate/anthranilate synthase component II [Planctomicrobium sp.]
MIFVLDNYDSFTYNLVQRLGEIDPRLDIQVRRNDQVTLDEIEQLRPERIIVSPGPCSPAEAGLSKGVIEHFGPKLPVLGVCLGHQAIGDVFGAKVVRAPRMMHGKTSEVEHDGQGVFAGLPNPMICTRYHSLMVPEETLPPELIPCAWVREPGHPSELMGIRHRDYAIHGVQFHPESFLSPYGIELLKNFLKL